MFHSVDRYNYQLINRSSKRTTNSLGIQTNLRPVSLGLGLFNGSSSRPSHDAVLLADRKDLVQE